jgi:hypothetical protein
MSSHGTWDISFLVDQDARILEGRGNCHDHLGEALQNLIGRSLTSMVVAPERKYLRRFLAQLGRPQAKRAVVIHLHSPAHGMRSYAMEAQQGRSAHDHWLLFAQSDRSGDTFDDMSLPPAMIDDGQFLRLVELAVAQASQALELTTIEVGGLSQPGMLAGREMERAAFERGIGDALSVQAYEGILSNPSPGFFNLLHEQSQSAATIAADLASVARQHGLSDQQAAIAHVSQPVVANATAESIRDAVESMRNRLPVQSWEVPPVRHISEGQVAASLGIGAFLLGIVAVAIWMLV